MYFAAINPVEELQIYILCNLYYTIIQLYLTFVNYNYIFVKFYLHTFKWVPYYETW